MWLNKTGDMKKPIILYDFRMNRSDMNPKKYSENFTGILQTDGYTGYNQVLNIERLHCLAHIRRKPH